MPKRSTLRLTKRIVERRKAENPGRREEHLACARPCGPDGLPATATQ